jgi:hypothetical protein
MHLDPHYRIGDTFSIGQNRNSAANTERERGTILISGAFISDGSWYDLVIDAGVLDVKGIDP